MRRIKALDKKECRKSGLRFSRKRKQCYAKCIRKTDVFDRIVFKCVKREDVTVVVEEVKKAIDGEEQEPIADQKLDKAVCTEASRRFSRTEGCTEECRSQLLTFDKKTGRCSAEEKIVEKIEEKVEEVLDMKCGEGKIFDAEEKNCVEVAQPLEEAPKFADIDFDRIECSKAGLRYSKKRLSCYIRCKKSKTKVFDPEKGKCVY